jgi:hypothetical protein
VTTVTDLAGLAVVATLGTDQRAAVPELPEIPGAAEVLPADPAVAVLVAAAVLDAAERAGARPARTEPPAPPPADPQAWPEWPAAATPVVRALLGRSPGVLTDLLGAAADAGFRCPNPLLPDLLDAVLRRNEAARAALRVLGAPGRRLLPMDPAWAPLQLLSTFDPDDDTRWRFGTPDERRSHLSELRRCRPDAARELLEASWEQETGRDRAVWVSVLRDHLSAADEAFLARAAADRATPVRSAAVALLGLLPDSAVTTAAVAASDGVLCVLPGRGGDPGLAVAPPAGSTELLSPGRLIELLAAVPPRVWQQRLEVDALQLVELPVRPAELTEAVRRGLRLAAVRFGSGPLAAALLRHPLPPPPRNQAATAVSDEQLAFVAGEALPGDLGVDWLRDLLRRRTAVPIVSGAARAVPGPWPDAVAEALPAWLSRCVATGAPAPPVEFFELCARRLPVGGTGVAGLEKLAEQLVGAVPPGRAVGAAARRLAELLHLRRRFAAALRPEFERPPFERPPFESPTERTT